MKSTNSSKRDEPLSYRASIKIHHLNIIPGGVFYACFKLGDFMTAALHAIINAMLNL